MAEHDEPNLAAAETAQPNVLDLSMKTLCRHAPAALLQLADVTVDPASISLVDVSVVLPEFRADQVLLIEADTAPSRRAVQFEYQTQPDSRLLSTWLLKNAALHQQLACPVFLVVLYLQKGDRATFPDDYRHAWGSLRNDYLFTAIRLWEHADRIRSGELAELAPVLVLCEDEPTEETVQEELELIRALEVSEETRADLLAVAYMMGTRFFLRGILDALFREEVDMLKDVGIISDWIAEGEARGEVRGRAAEARRMALRLMRRRFGDLPTRLVERMESADADWCEDLVERALQYETVDELMAALP